MAPKTKTKTMACLPAPSHWRAGLHGRLRLGLSALLFGEDAERGIQAIKQFESIHGHEQLRRLVSFQHWRKAGGLKVYYNISARGGDQGALFFSVPAIPGLPDLEQNAFAFLQIAKIGTPYICNVTTLHDAVKLHEEADCFTFHHVLRRDLLLNLETANYIMEARLSFHKEATTGEIKAQWHAERLIRRLHPVVSPILVRPRPNLQAMREHNRRLANAQSEP